MYSRDVGTGVKGGKMEGEGKRWREGAVMRGRAAVPVVARVGDRGHCRARCSNAASPSGRVDGRRRPRATGSGDTTPTALSALLEAVAPLRRGIELSRGADGDAKRRRLFALAEELRGCGQGSAAAASINDTWELVCTTERETLFILEKFATADEVYQVIDLAENGSRGSLFNIIRFGAEGRQFLVSSDIEAADDVDNRILFKFNGARFEWDALKIPLPPVGKGWFDNVFVDDEFRVAVDSRGVRYGAVIMPRRKSEPLPRKSGSILFVFGCCC